MCPLRTTDGRQRGGVTHVRERLRALGVGRLPLGFGSEGEQSLQFREPVEEAETEGEETLPKKEVLSAPSVRSRREYVTASHLEKGARGGSGTGGRAVQARNVRECSIRLRM